MARTTSIIFALTISAITSAQIFLPVCKTCPTVAQITQPGVGFAIEMGYGTAAVKFHNGTSQPIARIEGSSEYKELLLDLSHGPQQREWRNMGTTRDKMLYLLRRLRRYLSKQLGLPANRQTAVLAGMLSQLKSASESALEHNYDIPGAVLSFIDAARLPAEEVNDIFDYLQIQNLMDQPDGYHRLYAAAAAYGGSYGGLCKAEAKPYKCRKEEHKFSSEVLHLDFSDAALSMTRIRLTNAMDWEAMRPYPLTYLGFAKVEEDEQALFNGIREMIPIFVQKYIPPVTSVILTGTAASDERFIDTVKDALQDLVSVQTMESFSAYVRMTSDMDLVFATAKGAAEVAKRNQDGVVRCEWSEECKKHLAQLQNYTDAERVEL